MGITIEDLIKVSECYGKLYERADYVCKRCEAAYTCERETQKNIEKQPDEVPAWATVAVPGYEKNMPVFRTMTLEQLTELLQSFGDDVSQYDRYEHPKIRRLHMTADLKRHYARGDDASLAVCDTGK